ncbi:hypothetical protein ACWEFL_02730 [Streptomyces sp. NPDC004838]
MALRRRKPAPPDVRETAARLPKTMPSRFTPGDPRAAGHQTTYQSSRGGWLRKKP